MSVSDFRLNWKNTQQQEPIVSLHPAETQPRQACPEIYSDRILTQTNYMPHIITESFTVAAGTAFCRKQEVFSPESKVVEEV